jgi:hypothetical protein
MKTCRPGLVRIRKCSLHPTLNGKHVPGNTNNKHYLVINEDSKLGLKREYGTGGNLTKAHR